MSYILYEDNENNTRILSLAPGTNPINIKNLYPGSVIASYNELPDPDFIDATVISGETISLDLNKAKEVHKERLRQERTPLFKELDQLYLEADSRSKNLTTIKARQTYLRDITDDPAFDSAITLDDIKNITISSWTPPNINSETDVPDLTLKVTVGSQGNTLVVQDSTNVQGNLISKTMVTNISTAGPETLTASQLLDGLIRRDCNGADRTDTTDTAENIVASIDSCEVGSSYQTIISNISVNTLDLSSGTGVTFYDFTNIPANTTVKFLVVVDNVGSGTEAVSFYHI